MIKDKDYTNKKKPAFVLELKENEYGIIKMPKITYKIICSNEGVGRYKPIKEDK